MKMRKSMTAAAVALLIATAAFAGGEGLEIGDEALMTDVQMKNVDSSMVSIGEAAGEKGLLVIFTCNQCPWVKAWEERMAALGNEYAEMGVGTIMINSNDPAVSSEDSYEEMQRRAEQRGFGFPYVVDATSDVARAYDAKVTPEAFLFDADGKLVYHGTIDDNSRKPDEVQQRYLRDALAALVAGEEIATKETKSLGCTIKFRK